MSALHLSENLLFLGMKLLYRDEEEEDPVIALLEQGGSEGVCLSVWEIPQTDKKDNSPPNSKLVVLEDRFWLPINNKPGRMEVFANNIVIPDSSGQIVKFTIPKKKKRKNGRFGCRLI